MNKIPTTCLLAVLLIPGLSVTLQGQSVPADVSAVTQELQQIKTSLSDISSMIKQYLSYLEEDRELKKLEVGTRLMQLRQMSLDALDEQIRDLKERENNAREIMSRMEAELESINEKLADESESNQDPDARDYMVDMKGRLDREIDLYKDKIFGFQQRSQDLVNRKDSELLEIQSLKEYIMSALEDFTRSN